MHEFNKEKFIDDVNRKYSNVTVQQRLKNSNTDKKKKLL